MGSPFDRPPGYFVDPELKVEDPRLLDLCAYWRSLRDGGDLPEQDRFDPLDVPRHLGDLFVVRVEPGSVLRYTLIGTRIVEAIGRDATGKLVADTFPPDHPVNEAYRYLLAERRPVRTHGRLDWVHKDYRRFEGILLPLVDAEGAIAKIIGAAVYDSDV